MPTAAIILTMNAPTPPPALSDTKHLSKTLYSATHYYSLLFLLLLRGYLCLNILLP